MLTNLMIKAASWFMVYKQVVKSEIIFKKQNRLFPFKLQHGQSLG